MILKQARGVKLDTGIGSGNTFISRVKKDYKINASVYLMLVPVLLYYILFNYKPLYGLLLAFKSYSPAKGVMGSDWVGLSNFIDFFSSHYFKRVLGNTLWISINGIIWSFPVPVIFALLLNEIRNKYFVKSVQTITYVPHFISMVVVCGMIKDFTSDIGIVTYFLHFIGFDKINLLQVPGYFVPIYIISDIWQNFGWNSIIYLAAIAGVDQSLYEAATVDGAGKLKQAFHITLAGIMPTIVIMLILRMGTVLNVGFEKIILLYSPITYETADVISSFVYRRGLQENDIAYSTAVGIFNSVVNFALIMASNKLSKKINETSLW